jgi:hypothetical protein
MMRDRLGIEGRVEVDPELNQLTEAVIGAAIEVHREMGPGLSEVLLVVGRLIVELKAIDALLPIHKAQLITYLRITGHQLGLLINFNVRALKDGVRRVISTEDP